MFLRHVLLVSGVLVLILAASQVNLLIATANFAVDVLQSRLDLRVGAAVRRG